MEDGLDWDEYDERRATSANMMSVYNLIPREDGHISVRKTRVRDTGE